MAKGVRCSRCASSTSAGTSRSGYAMRASRGQTAPADLTLPTPLTIEAANAVASPMGAITARDLTIDRRWATAAAFTGTAGQPHRRRRTTGADRARFQLQRTGISFTSPYRSRPGTLGRCPVHEQRGRSAEQQPPPRCASERSPLVFLKFRPAQAEDDILGNNHRKRLDAACTAPREPLAVTTAAWCGSRGLQASVSSRRG